MNKEILDEVREFLKQKGFFVTREETDNSIGYTTDNDGKTISMDDAQYTITFVERGWE